MLSDRARIQGLKKAVRDRDRKLFKSPRSVQFRDRSQEAAWEVYYASRISLLRNAFLFVIPCSPSP